MRISPKRAKFEKELYQRHFYDSDKKPPTEEDIQANLKDDYQGIVRYFMNIFDLSAFLDVDKRLKDFYQQLYDAGWEEQYIYKAEKEGANLSNWCENYNIRNCMERSGKDYVKMGY